MPKSTASDREPDAARRVVRVLIASSRAAVHAFFVTLSADPRSRFAVLPLQLGSEDVDAHADLVAGADAAVIDVGVEQVVAVDLCAELREQRPDLPLAALFCCPHSVTPWELRALFSAGVSSVIDLQATSDEALRALHRVARGASVLHLESVGVYQSRLGDLLAGRELKSRTRVRLLELVAKGLHDREIAQRLHLSPHTVKHHIERLRAEVGVRNRTELAAWAGRYGFYSQEAGRPGR
jgi:DNA-binding NarL/FixJ family response regulator